MSYYNNPLAEILAALAATPEQGSSSTQVPPQYRRQFYYNPNEYDDDDDDYDYYQLRYPDYYSPLFGGVGGGAAAPVAPSPQQSYTPAQFAAQFGGAPRSRFSRTNLQRQSSQSQFPIPRQGSQQDLPLSRASSQARLNAQPLEVNEILSFLNNPRGRKPSDAGADLDADIAAALRKELEGRKSVDEAGRDSILESIKEDSKPTDEDKDDDDNTEPLGFSASGPSGGPTDTSGKLETPKQEKPTIRPVLNPAINPIVRRHSSLKTKDPQPKIEVSQRNTKNPKLPYSPSVNVYDTKDEYDIVLAIPGASLNDLDIDFHPSTNEIVIKGHINNISPFDEKLLKHSEIRAGSVERRVKFPTLPKIIDDKIKAKYLNGLLTIKVPKDNDESTKKPKRKVTIEDVPDEELEFEQHGGVVA